MKISKRAPSGNSIRSASDSDGKTQANVAPETTTVELLDEIEAEITRLRAKQKRLTVALREAQQMVKVLEQQLNVLRKQKGVYPPPPDPEIEVPVRKQALGKGLAQLFGPRDLT